MRSTRAPASSSGRTPTGSTPASSPTANGSISSATRGSMGWWRVRYVVTGAAGFIGSHLAEALQRGGPRGARRRRVHRLLRPGARSGTPRRSTCPARPRRRTELDLAGVDGVFHLAGQPGVRASWGDDFQLYVERNVLASQRVFEAAAVAGVRVVFASSSSVYGEAERYPTPEETPPRPISPYGITKLACEHLAPRSGASAGLDAVVLRYFTRLRPAAAAGHGVHRDVVDALARGGRSRLFGDGERSAELHVRRRRGRGDDRRRWSAAAPGAIYNVGGGEEATMNEAIALPSASPDARLDVERREAAAGDSARTKADMTRIADDLGWAARARRCEDGLEGAMGVGGGRVARVNTPPDLDAEQEVDLRSVWERIAARWWLPVLGIVLGLVVGFALALGGGKVYEAQTLVAMGQPFSPNGGAPVQSFLTNARAVSEIVRSESALEKAARASGLQRARPARERQLGNRRCLRSRRAADRRATRDDHGDRRAAAQGRESRRRARERGDRAHVGAVRRHEDQGVQRPARLDPGPAGHARAAHRPARAGRERRRR